LFTQHFESNYTKRKPWASKCARTLIYWKKSVARPISRHWLTKEPSQGSTIAKTNWHQTRRVPSESSHQGHLRRNLHSRKAKQRIVVEDVTYIQP
ncbi:hypothetical protein B296_00007225, partial [Ensete ventricosum]